MSKEKKKKMKIHSSQPLLTGEQNGCLLCQIHLKNDYSPVKQGKFHGKKWHISIIFDREKKYIYVKCDEKGSSRKRNGHFPRFQLERFTFHFIYKESRVWANNKAVTINLKPLRM